jgi:hypothetical protein
MYIFSLGLGLPLISKTFDSKQIGVGRRKIGRVVGLRDTVDLYLVSTVNKRTYVNGTSGPTV